MGWGQGIGIGWPNATSVATPVPTNVYYNILSVCSGEPFDSISTNLVNPNVYTTGDYVYSTTINDGVLLGDTQLGPGDIQVEIIGPVNYGCPVTALESYVIVDCILGEEYTSGYYDAGNFALGDRVYTQYGNYGWVQNITTAQEGDQSDGFPIGYVDDRCNDCIVSFSFQVDSDGGDFYLGLYATESLGEVPWASDVNELIINVNYSINIGFDESPPINMNGSATFEIPSYNVPNGIENYFIGDEYLFSLSEDASVNYDEFNVTSISIIDTALGPYDIGWNVPNRYVTNYGNVWTFYYPT